ncbi:MAG: hypothetical protein V1664_02195 [Candidatus Uhrbacteria bacterium]
MEKMLLKRPKKTKAFLIFLVFLAVIFSLVLFIPRPGETNPTGFFQFLSVTVVIFSIVGYCFFLSRWERIIVENGFLKIRYAHFFLPCFKQLLISEVKELVFVYNGFIQAKKFVDQEMAKVRKTKILEKLNEGLTQKKFQETLSDFDEISEIHISALKILFKTDQAQVRVSFFSKEATLKIIKLFSSEVKFSGRLKQIEYNSSSSSYGPV